MIKSSIYRTHLSNRCIIKIKGKESLDFLQNIITNDINLLSDKRSIYSALLNPQGKYLYDFIIFMNEKNKGEIFLESIVDRSNELIKTLNMYKLRKKIEITKLKNYKIFTLFGRFRPQFLENLNIKDIPGFSNSKCGAVIFIDPRHKNLGLRVINFSNKTPKFLQKVKKSSMEILNLHRINLCIPDCSQDLEINKSFLLENNFENLNCIDFDKGCYIGQENTARQKYRGTLKKKLMKVKIYGESVPNGSKIVIEDKIIGKMRSSINNIGLATIKIEEAKKIINKKNKLTKTKSFIKILSF